MRFLEEQAKKEFIINVIFIFLWTVILIIAGKILLRYLFPFLLAFVVATLVQKPAKAISEILHIKKGICAALISAILYVAVALLMIFGIFKIFSLTRRALTSVSDISDVTIHVFDRIKNIIGEISSHVSYDFENTVNKMLTYVVDNVFEQISVFLSAAAASIVKTAPAFLFSGVVALAATCYIAKDFEGLVKFSRGIIGDKNVKILNKITKILKSSVLKMLGGYLILVAITFFELAIGLLILRIKNWLIFALIIAFIDVLPIFGVGIVLIPWGITSIILGNGFQGIGFLVLYLIITLIRNFAEPKIVGNKTGINPLFILFAMFFGMKLFGFWGLLILPVTFIVVIKYYKNEMEKESSP